MQTIQADLSQTQLFALPDDPKFLDHHVLLCGNMRFGENKLPKSGMLGFMNVLLSDISIQVFDDHLVLHQQLHQDLTLTPKSINVFVNQIDPRQNVTIGDHPGPIYRTMLQVVTDELTVYLHIPSAIVGQHLLLNPGHLPVHDLLGLAKLPPTDSDYVLNDAINAIGFKSWIQGTGLEFLADSSNVAGHYHVND